MPDPHHSLSLWLFQEVNAVYNLGSTADQDQSQLLHKIIKESYTAGQLQHNYIYDQQVGA